ncbi:MAG: ankyrin repeat domain-containing protein [Candidatus Midichloria sp.]|nr:ankyrin repeat domain-containing protein [Candidatus Midichloria sp.]
MVIQINTIKNITSTLSKDSSNSQLFEHIIGYLSEKQGIRSSSEDGELLLWLLKNDKIEVFVKLLSDSRIFGPSSVGLLSKKNTKEKPKTGKLNSSDDNPVILKDNLINKIVEKLYDSEYCKPFFQKLGEINRFIETKVNPQLSPEERKKQLKEAGYSDDVIAELKRLLDDLHNSIYAGDLSYIQSLLSLLPAELKSTMPLNKFVEAINTKEEEKILILQRSAEELCNETAYVIGGWDFFGQLHQQVETDQMADKFIGGLMNFGLGVGFHLLRDSTEFLENFQSALEKCHFKDIRDKEGNTLLHKACLEGNADIVKIILTTHQDGKISLDFINNKNNAGLSFDDCAQLCQEREVRNAILSMLSNASKGQHIQKESTLAVEISR